MFIIGITGGICAGKSSVSRILQELGVRILDADKLGHKAYEPNTECFRKLVEHFGEGIVDDHGEVDRKKLGSIVFSDQNEMKSLQSIVWPEIRRLIVENFDRMRLEGNQILALEAAVMIEAGWNDLVSCLWVITARRDVALARLMRRNNLTEEEAIKRIDAQISNEERCAVADLVIDNSKGSMEDLEKIVRSAYAQLPSSS